MTGEQGARKGAHLPFGTNDFPLSALPALFVCPAKISVFQPSYSFKSPWEVWNTTYAKALGTSIFQTLPRWC